jgi:hypothetical protein
MLRLRIWGSRKARTGLTCKGPQDTVTDECRNAKVVLLGWNFGLVKSEK